MIGKLCGIVDEIYDNNLILDVHGVGYIVHCSKNILNKVNKQDKITLFIDTQVNEGNITMFGFESRDDNAIFLCLTSVQGVGGKVAVSIISKYNTQELVEIIRQKQPSFLQAVSGIGPKLATRIVNELSSNKTILSFTSTKELSLVKQPSPLQSQPSDSVMHAIQALVQLGFHKQLATSTISQIIEHQESYTTEDLIKTALKELGRTHK